MVWQQNSSIIVMLTNEIEGNKLKCHPYWGRGTLDAKIEYGDLQVQMIEEKELTAWKVRSFKLTNKKVCTMYVLIECPTYLI
jgi:Protein tyrosine phosphatase